MSPFGGSATLTHPPGARLSSRCLIGRRFPDAGSSYVVEKVSPGPYLELFGRTPRPGWSVWGSDSTREPRIRGTVAGGDPGAWRRSRGPFFMGSG